MIEVGKKAPAFTLPNAEGTKVRLSDFAGKPVIVYFYPKDDTPGCTTQACGIRDQWSDFQEAGAVVLGISPDDATSHDAFRRRYDLPHTLLSDPSHQVMEEYGAWGEKVLYGKTVIGTTRSTVLVGPDGLVLKHWKAVQTKTHAERVLKAMAKLL
ncbi:MAG: peroxiredoxin Q/BCP [Glaciecola sp.]|jgi:peroxiredoxin Q/BCP